MNYLRRLLPVIPCVLLALGPGAPAWAASSAKIKVLIIDGQNNHQWATTTPILKRILEQSGLFNVDVTTTPPRPADPKFTLLLPGLLKPLHPSSSKPF